VATAVLGVNLSFLLTVGTLLSVKKRGGGAKNMETRAGLGRRHEG
jgi:hypothetical protein